MKCPKCDYLGFEAADRCRNCGYEFSLSEPAAPPELPLKQQADQSETLDDYTLIDAGNRPGPKVAPERGRRARSAPPSTDLPLFLSAIPDDAPLITKPSPPRPPLAVRRSTPEVPRTRTEAARAPNFDLSPDRDDLPPVGARLFASERAQTAEWLGRDVLPEPAGMLLRMAAATVDVLLLVAIDAVVIYFTMQICGVTTAEFALIPKRPLAAFLVVQNVGYLVAFTTGGQTLGKMAAGIKIIASDPHDALDVGRALKRTVMWLLLAFPAGLGFLTAFFTRDHRGLHDRFAGTSVVRASA